MLLTDAIDSFLRDLDVGRSPATVRTYRVALRRFAEYRLARTPERLSLEAITADDLLDFTRHLSRARSPRTTIETYTTAISRFYAFLVREGLRTDLPLETLQLRLAALRGKRRRALPRVPSDEVIDRIVLQARGDTGTSPLIRMRNIAIVETLRGSGIRVAELVGLRRGDLDRSRRSAIVTGKGEKQRLVLFTDSAWIAIEEYVAARGDTSFGRGLAHVPLFSRHDRATPRVSPLSTNAIRAIVWGLAQDAGLMDAALTPHRFRAWFATHLVAATGDLAAVQDLLGHESADTTRVYTRVAATRLREIHARAFASNDSKLQSANVG